MSRMNPDTKDGPAAGMRGISDHALQLVLVAGLYVAMAKLGLYLASVHPSVSPIWPPTGLGIAAVLLLGSRIAPAIFVGAFLANVTTEGSLSTSLAIALGNSLESILAASLTNRWSGGRNTFDTPSGVAKFALICFAPSTVSSATIGVLSLSIAGYANWSDFFSIWFTWWMGDLAGALVITPAIVLWYRDLPRAARRQELSQSGVVYTAALVIGLIAFSPLMGHHPVRTPLAFLSILPLLWAALRRNQRDTATTALILSTLAVWGTLSLSGPFVRGSLNESFLLLLAFLMSVSVPSLALSAEVAVRKRHDEELEFVMRELSHRSKNILSVVQNIAQQVGRRSDGLEDFLPAFTNRLCAFAATHDLLVQENWRGANIRDLVRVHLEPFHNSGEHPIIAAGPNLFVGPKAAEQIGLALHELGTNAVKHGALSVPSGIVNIRWSLATGNAGDRFRFSWKEAGGPRVSQNQRPGFGDIVLTKVVPTSLNGVAKLDFNSAGVTWELDAPPGGIVG